jgi:hypothetical protein
VEAQVGPQEHLLGVGPGQGGHLVGPLGAPEEELHLPLGRLPELRHVPDPVDAAFDEARDQRDGYGTPELT